jgi:hypothetical protein
VSTRPTTPAYRRKWHESFLAEYEAAVQAAQRVERYRTLHDRLRLWRMRAIAFSAPDFEGGFQAAAEGRSEEFVPVEQVFPGWVDRATDHRASRRSRR